MDDHLRQPRQELPGVHPTRLIFFEPPQFNAFLMHLQRVKLLQFHSATVSEGVGQRLAFIVVSGTLGAIGAVGDVSIRVYGVACVF